MSERIGNMSRRLRSHLAFSMPLSSRALIVILTVASLVLLGGLGFWWNFRYNTRPTFSDPYICRFLDTNEVSNAVHHKVVSAHVVHEPPNIECNIYLEEMPWLLLRGSPNPDSVVAGGYGGISHARVSSMRSEQSSDTVYEVDTGVPNSSAYVVLTPDSPHSAFAVWFSPGTNQTVGIVQAYDRDYIGQDYSSELKDLIVHVAKAFDHAYRTGETFQPEPTDEK